MTGAMIGDLLQGVALLIASWAVIGLTIVGLGLPLLSCIGRRGGEPWGLELSFWLGLAVAIGVLQVWHLFLPVDLHVAALLAIGGAAGLLRHRARIAAAFHGWAGARWLAVGSATLLTLLCALWALATPLSAYDAGLYHLQAIQWYTSYPTVAGLGNLHSRLAFNSAWFLFLALLQSLLGSDWFFRVGSSLLVLVILISISFSLLRSVAESSLTNLRLFEIVLIVPLVGLIAVEGVSTTSTDLPALVLQVVVARQLIAMCQVRTVGAGWLVVVGVLVVLGMAIKLSFAFYAALALIAALGLILSCDGWRHVLRRAALGAAAIGTALFVPWLFHGFILSGYPLYPSTLLGAAVDWRVSAAQADADRVAIAAFARAPGPEWQRATIGWDWVSEWTQLNWRELAPPLATSVVGVAALMRWLYDRASVRVALVGVLPAWGAIVAWFLSAPDPRFAGALFWISAAGAAAWTAHLRKLRYVLAAVAAAAVVAAPISRQATQLVRVPVALVRGRAMLPPPVPTVALVPFVTDSGLRVWVPAVGEQAWSAPLPSTPYPDAALRARCTDDLGCGFTKTRP